MPNDEFNLGRFLKAQDRIYSTALSELIEGRKRSHWIWFILPQLQGLGLSSMSRTFGIASLAEARAYLAHPVLGPRLVECIEAILGHGDLSAEAMLGDLDALKFRSCLSLFSMAAPSVPIFAEALQRFFAGTPDPKTLARLKAAGDI